MDEIMQRNQCVDDLPPKAGRTLLGSAKNAKIPRNQRGLTDSVGTVLNASTLNESRNPRVKSGSSRGGSFCGYSGSVLMEEVQ